MKLYDNYGQPIREDNNKNAAEILGNLFKIKGEMKIIVCVKHEG